MIIIDIAGVHITVPADLGARIIAEAQCLTSTGYGAEERWEERDASITMRSVDDSKLLSEDASLAKALKDAATAESKVSELGHKLWREEQFWANRAKAHARGVTDEQLRKNLNGLYSFSVFDLEKIC